MITTITLSEAIQNARNINACDDDIEAIEKFNNWDEFLNHKSAPFWLYWYCENVIKDRWNDAEEYIMKDLELAYWYAKNIIKNRWIDAEKYIKKNPEWWDEYNDFIKEL